MVINECGSFRVQCVLFGEINGVESRIKDVLVKFSLNGFLWGVS